MGQVLPPGEAAPDDALEAGGDVAGAVGHLQLAQAGQAQQPGVAVPGLPGAPALTGVSDISR